MATHNDLGKEGEQQALIYLKHKGYEILDVNWRGRKGELDIVALFADRLVIVEVKTRTSLSHGEPQFFVDDAKIKKIVKTADEYIHSKNRLEEARFDIIGVYKHRDTWELNHIEDAFYYF